jgi:hypothetical protein
MLLLMLFLSRVVRVTEMKCVNHIACIWYSVGVLPSYWPLVLHFSSVLLSMRSKGYILCCQFIVQQQNVSFLSSSSSLVAILSVPVVWVAVTICCCLGSNNKYFFSVIEAEVSKIKVLAHSVGGGRRIVSLRSALAKVVRLSQKQNTNKSVGL